MTHVSHPYAQRLGILRDWKSRWFSGDWQQYRENLREDVLLREYLEKRLRGMFISSIDMERSDNNLRIVIKTSRPGILIGHNGEGMARLKKDVLSKLGYIKPDKVSDVKIDVEEIRMPEADAAVAAYMIAEGLEKRLPFRRILKQTAEKVNANREVQGVKIELSGRLGGAEMARNEKIMHGRVPLQTLRADVDFAREKAYLPYGVIGIKVWIFKGEVFE